MVRGMKAKVDKGGAGHDNRPIGVFDSGLGGLTVAAALQRDMPEETIIYLGDTARVPYGTKSRETIIRFALEDARFLIEREVKLVVAACNTVSAIAMPALHEAWPSARFVGVVEAGVAAALALPGLERVAVIGTEATIASDSYRLLLHRQNPRLGVRGIACPLFVPLVEQGWVDGPIAEQVCAAYLGELLAQPPDAVILGCTHYPLLTATLRQMLPETVRIVDSAEACAQAVRGYLHAHGLTATPGNGNRHQYFVTDMPASFFALASRFLGQPVRHVDKVSL
jgi:glutamate racemase